MKRMRYFFQISVLVIAFITHPQITKAQQIFTFQKVIKTVNNANQRFLKFDIYQIDIDAIKSKIDSSSQNSEVETFVFDLPGRDMYSFSLQPHDLRGPNYKLTIATEYGISYSPRSENKTYRGFTSRDHKDVRFTLDNGFMSGIIDLGNDKLIFEPMLSDSSKRSGAKMR
jgi:hypothetical protein